MDNITKKALGVDKSFTATVISAGLGYAPSPSFYAEATLVKEKGRPIGLLAALQYAVQDKLIVKGGVATGSSSFYFGAGYSLGTLG